MLLAVLRVKTSSTFFNTGNRVSILDIVGPLRFSVALGTPQGGSPPTDDGTLSFGDPGTGTAWSGPTPFGAGEWLYVFVWSTNCKFSEAEFTFLSEKGRGRTRITIRNTCFKPPPNPLPVPFDTGVRLHLTGSARATDSLLTDVWAHGGTPATEAPSTDFDPTPGILGPGRAAFASGITRVWMPVNVGIRQIASPERTRDRSQVLFLKSDSRHVTNGRYAELFYVPNSAGSNAIRLTDFGVAGRSVLSAAWSPDKTMIALFVTETGGTTARLHVYDFSARTLTPYGFAAVPAGTPRATWSPDGGTIAFGNGQISLLDLATGAVTPLLAGTDPDWHPTSDRIVFSDRGTLWETDSTGSTPPIRLTDETVPSGNDRLAQWSPGGIYIGFAREIEGTDHLTVLDLQKDPDQETWFTNVVSPMTHLDW